MPPQIFEPDGPRSRADVDAAVEFGAVDFVRPQMMTVTAIIAGLLPILWAHGAGADVMKRIAAPTVGGWSTALAHQSEYSALRKRGAFVGVPSDDQPNPSTPALCGLGSSARIEPKPRANAAICAWM